MSTPGAYSKSFSLDFGKYIPGIFMLHYAKSMHLLFCHHQHGDMHDPNFLGN